jgi:hypothetical protein
VLNQNAVADDANAVRTDDEARTLLAEYPVLALRAENERLRETVMQLTVENDTLREQAARRLAHRILDGVKQSGKALLALVVAFDGIAFPRRQLPARHRNSESRTQRVVVHGLVTTGTALAMGILAFVSFQDPAMLGKPSVRSGTMASSGQETPEAAARSGGLPAEAERRGSISGQQSSAAMVTPEAIPQPPAPKAMVASIDDLATQPATLPPARAAEALPGVTSPAPVEEQMAPPPTSLTISPPPTQSPPNQRLSAAEMAALVTRGDAFLGAGDIVSARLFYERAADAGDGSAALRLGVTFDPAFRSRTGVRSIPDDPAQALSWYRRAADLGNPAAQEHLQSLEQHHVPTPGSPPH